MSQAYLDLLHKIDEFIRKYYLNKVVRGIIWLTGIFIVCYLFAVTAEYFGYFSPSVKTILFYTFLGSQLILSWILVLRHFINYLKLGKIISYEQASEIIGYHFPEINDKLINTLQLKKLSEENSSQKALIEASINQRIAAFQPIPFVAAVKISENKKYLRYALLPIAAMVIIAFSAPSVLTDGTTRFIHHDVFYKKKAPFNFEIQNAKLEAVQGDDFTLKVKMTGNEIPQDIYIEDGVNTFKLDKKDIINFSYSFKNLQKDKKFRLVASEFSSDEYQLIVKNKPALLSYQVQFIYPSYLHKNNETLANPGDLTLPEGTVLKWTFKTEYVSDFDFQLDHKSSALTPEEGGVFSHQANILKNSTYSLLLQNEDKSGRDSIAYHLNVIADEYPKIEVNSKPDSTNSRVVYFIGKASDDYGLSSLNFHYQILKSDKDNRKGKSFDVPVNFDKGKNQSSFFYLWQLKEIGIQPGEEISYYFDVADNDGVSGPKHTHSATQVYQLPSKDEALKNIEENSNSIKQKMQQAIRQAAKIQQQAQKLNQDLMDQKNLGYEQKKQIDELLDQKKKLDDLLKDIQKDSKQNLFERKELQPDEKELLEKQKQIQDLFDHVLDEKTKKILENLQKLMEQNQKDLSQDQLQQVQTDNKSLQKELDRILELYKKLEFEQKLNDAIDKLKDLAQKQDDLSKKSAQTKDTETTQKEQKDLEKQFSDVQKDLKEVDEKNQALDQPEDFKNPKEAQKDIQQDMEDASQSLQQNKSQKASKAQQSAAQKMQQLAQKLEQMQQSSQSMESNVNMQELRQILQNLLKSSFDQEKVMLDIKKTDINDPEFVQLGQKQREIKDNLKMVEDSLYSLSKRVPQIESTVNKEIQTINDQISASLDNLSDRKVAEANRNQQFALTSINNLALMLSDALQQLQNAMKNAKGGGKGQKQPGLAQLSKMQKELNKNMQKAKEQMQQQGIKPGQKGSGQMSEQLAKMAQQQQMIRQALQDINNKMNKDGQGKLGDLEKIMKEMEQTETDLVNKRITQEAMMRQQEIQTRLLEAEKAEREREQDNQRESNAGKDFAPDYNLIMQEYQKLKAKEVEQIKTVPPTLNYFYKSKISDYFKKLNSGN